MGKFCRLSPGTRCTTKSSLENVTQIHKIKESLATTAIHSRGGKAVKFEQDSGSNKQNRRDFALATAGLGAAAWASLAAEANAAESPFDEPLIRAGDTILFQGDSITDAGRDRSLTGKPNDQKAMGKGYAWLAASQILVSQPDLRLKVFNRGISGNKVFQLADRWQQDCIVLKPNLLSILIGVNDIWHKLDGKYDGTVEVYEHDYQALIERTKKSLPRVKLVVCEPFVLRCGAVDETWFPMFDNCRAAARRVADSAGARFVPFQSMFDAAVQYAPPQHWAADGVHPTSFGAALMAHAWLEAVSG